MVTDKVQGTYDVAALDKTESYIWKRLTIIETEAWFNTVTAIAMEHQVRAKLESRYMKEAIICGADYRRIGRIWHLDESMPIYFDIKAWITHYESADTLTEAIRQIANTANQATA